MSCAVVITVHCNGCTVSKVVDQNSVAAARRYLKTKCAWAYRYPGLDYCPNCRDKAKGPQQGVTGA